MPPKSPNLRSRLEQERTAADLRQVDLARFAHVAQSTISALENSKNLSPSFEVLSKLAWALQRCGRKVQPAELQPKRQPLLVKGLLNQPRKRRRIA